jgi:mevalonate kinase
MKESLFNAKVLLFGEYGLIQNSKGLTLPYDFYRGTLKFGSNKDAETLKSNENLREFAVYLENNLKENATHFLDFAKLQNDIKDGMYFDSTIPQGYGIGSSGALVASIYDRYSLHKITVNKSSIDSSAIQELKSVFSKMESFFHGTSSGIDPLICYLNIPLIIHSKNDIHRASISSCVNGKGAVFLIDTKQVGKTAPMIELFFSKLKNKGFRKTMKEEFILYNNACVDAFVKGEYPQLFDNLKNLSSWVYVYLKPMIPKKMYALWEQGIKTNSYYLKLCGSGNGGYILGFAKDFQQAKQMLEGHSVEVIYRF